MDAQENEEKDKMGTEGKGEELESKIRRIEHEIKEFVGTKTLIVDRDSNIEFADLVWDNTLLHRSQTYAINMGLQDTPLLGMLLAASSEQYALDILEKINSHPSLGERVFHYVGHQISFRNPAFPNQEIRWELQGIKVSKKREDYELYGDVLILDIKAPESLFKKGYASCEITLAMESLPIELKRANHFRAVTDLDTGKFDGMEIREEPVVTEEKSIIKKPLERFYGILGVKPKKEVPRMWYAASIPAALLDIGQKKYAKDFNPYFFSADFKFYKTPIFGSFKTTILKPKRFETKRKHTFEAIVDQKETEEPILEGKVKVSF